MGQASWLGMCPNSLHKVEVRTCSRDYCTLGLRFELAFWACAHIVLSPINDPHPQPLAEASLGLACFLDQLGLPSGYPGMI